MNSVERRNKILEGPVVKNLFRLASPIIIAMSLHTSFNFIDMLFVGRLGKEAIAAVSMAFPVQLLIIAVGGGTGIGITSLISRNIGAENFKGAETTARQCVPLIIMFSIITAVAGSVFAKPFFMLLGAESTVLELVVTYIKPILVGSIFMYMNMLGNAIFRGQGNTITPMKIMIASVLINIALDPLLIFGIGPFPRLGVLGAATATVMSRALGNIVLLYFLKSKDSISKWFFSPSPRFNTIKNIFIVGVPSSLAQLINNASMLVLFGILTRFGNAAVAAYGIGFKLDLLAFLPGIGLSSGNMIMIGQNFGAQKIKRVRRITSMASIITGGFMTFIGLIYFVFPAFWIKLFNSDPELVLYGVNYLRIVTLSYFFYGVILITMSTFQGSGRGFPALVITFLRLFIVLIPSALILSNYLKVSGIWWAIALSNLITALFGIIWLHIYISRINKSFPSDR